MHMDDDGFTKSADYIKLEEEDPEIWVNVANNNLSMLNYTVVMWKI